MREINRRNFVITNLSGATILLAGCLDESSGDDPEGVAKDMLKEIFEPDRQGAFKLSHRDGPASETIPDFVLMPDPSTEIENIETEITEEEENRVVVELTFDIDYVGETPKKAVARSSFGLTTMTSGEFGQCKPIKSYSLSDNRKKCALG